MSGFKHGFYGSVEHRAWYGMIRRCHHPEHADWPEYGGRGVTVCDRWRDSYLAFLNDVGRRPSDRHSIDRIDNNKGYEPGNVRWATAKEQANNRRKPPRPYPDTLNALQPWEAVGLSRRTWYRYGKPATREEADATRKALQRA